MERNTPFILRAFPILIAAMFITACNKDDVTEPALDSAACATPTACGTVTDIDGNAYSTVQIGNHCWMAENLKVSRYRNGDAIPAGVADSAWLYTTEGAYTVYENNPANEVVFGKLYNWHAVSDSRGLCPQGWHVATDSDWMDMEAALGMPASELDTLMFYRGQSANVGGKLKGNTHWIGTTNTGADNCSGMNFKPAGCLGAVNNGNNQPLATYGNQGDMVWAWTSTSSDATYAIMRGIYRLNAGIGRGKSTKDRGFSCRCVAD